MEIVNKISSTRLGECSSSFETGPSSADETRSSDPKEHDLHQNIQRTAAAVDAVDDKEKVNVDLDGLIKQISGLLEFHSKKSLHPKPETHDYWPISSSVLLKLKDCLTEGAKCAETLKDIISSQDSSRVVRDVLNVIGHANLAAAGLLVVSHILERFEHISQNQKECLSVLEEMTKLAKHVKRLKERDRLKQEMEDTIKETTELIVKASIMCSSQMDVSCWSKFFKSQSNMIKLQQFQRKLKGMYRRMDQNMGICVFDAIEYPNMRPLITLERAYPKYAVGIEKRVKEVLRLLDSESESNALAVMLHGFGGTGKTTLADAVFARVCIKGCKYSMVRLFDDITSTPNIVRLQKLILQDLNRQTGGKKTIPDIGTFEEGQREIGHILEKDAVFIYIDNALHRDALEQLLPRDMTKAKNLRLLITARDKDVLRGCRHLKKRVYLMKFLDAEEAKELLNNEIHHEKDELYEQINSSQLDNIVQICGGIPRLLISVAGFIDFEADKQKAYRAIIQEKEKLTGQLLADVEHYVFHYESLPEMCKDPFLDICAFFKGWDWNTVSDIVGDSELDMLENRALVTKDTNMTLTLHDVILAIGNQKGRGSRFIITNEKQWEELLVKDMHGIKGLWFKENKDLLDMPATKLNSISDSLRILALGEFTRVKEKCIEKFEKLLFFQGEISDLPFHVSHLKELRYLNFQPQNLDLFKEIQSDLRHMELNGKGLSDVWKIPSSDVQQLQHLRALKLVGFKDVGKLLDQLGNSANGLQELIISYCSSVQELSKSISNFQGLRVLRINYCSNISVLAEDLTLLKYLRELDTEGCESLKVSLGVSQWKRVILNEKGCQNLGMYLRSLDVLSLNDEDCESEKVYLEPSNVPQWKTLLLDLDEEEACESVPVYVDSPDISQWEALKSNILEEIQ